MAVSLKNKLAEVDYKALLQVATCEKGIVSSCYGLFHDLSLLNTLSLLSQFHIRGVEPAPVKTFNGWKALGRHVNRGEKAYFILFPKFAYIPVSKQDDQNADGDSNTTDKNTQKADIKGYYKKLIGFETKCMHFALTQTSGKSFDVKENNPFNISIPSLVKAFDITMIPFTLTDGNVQGYCNPEKSEIAINPVAENGVKTFIHELAHCLLHSDRAETLNISRNIREVEAETVSFIVLSVCNQTENLATSRGYIQSWLKDDTIDDKTAKRIFFVADKILKAIKSDTQKADTEGMAN